MLQFLDIQFNLYICMGSCFLQPCIILVLSCTGNYALRSLLVYISPGTWHGALRCADEDASARELQCAGLVSRFITSGEIVRTAKQQDVVLLELVFLLAVQFRSCYLAGTTQNHHFCSCLLTIQGSGAILTLREQYQHAKIMRTLPNFQSIRVLYMANAVNYQNDSIVAG